MLESKTQPPPSAKPVARKNTCRQIFLVGLVGGVLCFGIAIPLMRIIGQSGTIWLTQEAILQDTVTTIVPKNGYDIHYTTLSGFQSSHFYLKFTLPSSDLSDFIQVFCRTIEMSDEQDISLNNMYNIERLEWWKPEGAKVYSVGGCEEGKFKYYDLFIDKSNPRYFTVYITQ